MDCSAGSLAGKTALVTGGARRVGAVIARRMADEGARVLVHCHSSVEAAEELVRELSEGSGVVRADLATPSGPQELFSQLDRLGESPDLLVHAASAFVAARLEDTDAETWDRSLGLNVRAFGLLAREIQRRRGPSGGHLIAIADAAAIELWPGYLAHSVAKAGLVALVKALAKAMAPSFRVNGVIPGPVLPPETSSELERAAMAGRTLLGSLGDPEDVASAVAFLATSSFVTGALIHVTGGSELWRGNVRSSQA